MRFRAVILGSIVLTSVAWNSAANTDVFAEELRGKQPVKAISGVVVGSADKPVADVRVFNTGDAPQTISTNTDGAGRFRLEGLRSGPVYVFAEKKDYRFTGVRTTSGAAGLVIRLLRKEEPPPAPPPRRELPSYEEQKKLARKMLERLWASWDHRQLALTIPVMARIDEGEAQKWSTELGGPYDRLLGRIRAEKAAETDLDEALSLFAREERGSAWNPLHTLVRRYATSDPAKAMRCVEEMVVQARVMDQPFRTVHLAEAGGLAIRLGNKEGGRKLIEEAAQMLATVGGEGQNRVRGKVAERMASYDVKRALRLLEPIRDRGERDLYLGYVAMGASLNDLDAALAILKDVKALDVNQFKLRIVHRVVLTQPTEALSVVESMEEERLPMPKAEAFGWLAVAIAPRDKALACSLIDRGLSLCLGHSDAHHLWRSYEGPASKAAFLAGQAKQIGSPDMQSVVYRVLASRPTGKGAYSAAREFGVSVAMAAILALADPETAKEVLQTIERRSEVIATGETDVKQDDWLKAWALADPEHAEQLFERELAKLKEKTEDRLWRSGVLSMAEMLATPPPERSRYIFRNQGIQVFRFPEEEY